jgi:hypothetical protein
MSSHRPTPRRHHATSTNQWLAIRRPKEDLDGAARMSCTRRRRGAPWPPAFAHGGGAGQPRGGAPGSRGPAGRLPHSLCSISSPITKLLRWRRKRGEGEEQPPAAGQAPPLLSPAGGAHGGLLNPLATVAASSAGRRGLWAQPARRPSGPPPGKKQ